MAEDHRPGAVYWIDHYVVGTNNLEAWSDFYSNVFGAIPREMGTGRNDRRPPAVFTFVGKRCHVGAFVQDQELPPATGLGEGRPRYSWFIRPEDINEHLRRLDRYHVPHTDPVRTSEEGQDGNAVCFADPDGNQLELWAPTRMPDGAMDEPSAVKIGKICGVAQESRDLQGSADFYTRFCAIDPIYSADIPKDTLAFALEGGGRIVFKETDSLSLLTGGHSQWRGLHTALVVRDDEMMPAYERMWAALPESSEEAGAPATGVADEARPARTGYHGNPAGKEWIAEFGRGDEFYDWDTNSYHFVGGVPVEGSMGRYTSRGSRTYIAEHAAARGNSTK